MADLAKYLYIPESELTEQLKFSIIKSRVLAKTDQMPYKIYEDKRKKNVRVVNLSVIALIIGFIPSSLLFITYQKLVCFASDVSCFQYQLIKVVGLRF